MAQPPQQHDYSFMVPIWETIGEDQVTKTSFQDIPMEDIWEHILTSNDPSLNMGLAPGTDVMPSDGEFEDIMTNTWDLRETVDAKIEDLRDTPKETLKSVKFAFIQASAPDVQLATTRINADLGHRAVGMFPLDPNSTSEVKYITEPFNVKTYKFE
jgi:hypothetical protein